MQTRAVVTPPLFNNEESRSRYMAAYDAALAQWPVPYESVTVPTRLGTTHVIVSGPADAPPLVLLHSMAGTATVWRTNAQELSRHFRTYAVDVIGQAGRSAADRKIRDRRDFAVWMTDLFDALGLERPSIVGCSFGGFLALSQAALTPDRVGRVVLISPAGTFVGLSLRFVITMMTAPFRRRLRRLMGDRRAASLADLRVAPPRDAVWATLMGVTMAERPRMNLISAAVLGVREVRAIRAPTLLLIGDQERLYPPAATLDLAKRRMPALETGLVPGADHIAAMAQPDDVNARIVDFLTRG